MQNTRIKSALSLVVCIALIAALALMTIGCGDIENPGEKTFTLIVINEDGKESATQITTDKATVGEALMAQGILEGENGAYGLYVKTVNGITVDYDKDGKYWAFYVNGEYAQKGVDKTAIIDGETYTFRVE